MDLKEQPSCWCIFENKICKHANKQDTIFECMAKTDKEMLCRKEK